MQIESVEVINMWSFVQLEGSMKVRIIVKQKCKFLIDKDIVETLICELLFGKSGKDEKGNKYQACSHGGKLQI